MEHQKNKKNTSMSVIWLVIIYFYMQRREDSE